MLQEYKNILIHINAFKESYNINQRAVPLQEMYYRYILDYLFAKYDLYLLGDCDKDVEKIVETAGIYAYFQNIYTPKSKSFQEENYYSIMRDLYCSDNRRYLVIGRNTNEEIIEARKGSIPTCMISSMEEDSLIRSTYTIDSFEKIKTIL